MSTGSVSCLVSEIKSSKRTAMVHILNSSKISESILALKKIEKQFSCSMYITYVDGSVHGQCIWVGASTNWMDIFYFYFYNVRIWKKIYGMNIGALRYWCIVIPILVRRHYDIGWFSVTYSEIKRFGPTQKKVTPTSHQRTNVAPTYFAASIPSMPLTPSHRRWYNFDITWI